MSGSKTNKKQAIVLCHRDCPNYGIEHKHLVRCMCECGAAPVVCAYCLEAGRELECPKCYVNRLRSGAGDN